MAETGDEATWRVYAGRVRQNLSTAVDSDESGVVRPLLASLAASVMLAFWLGVAVLKTPLWAIGKVYPPLKGNLVTWAGNIRGLLGKATVDQLIPPGWRSNISWFLGVFPDALGIRGATPWEQVKATVVLMIVAALTSLIPLTSTIGIASIFILSTLFWYAVLFRTNEQGEKLHEKVTGRLPIKADYNVPGWRGE